MSKKIAVIHQGFIPIYRAKTFEILNKISNNSYVVVHGEPPSNSGHQKYEGKLDFPNLKTTNYEISFLGRRMIYQPVIKDILFGSYDAVVLGHEIKFIANLILFGLCKILSKPVIWWGHGFEKEEDRGRLNFLAPLIAKMKVWLARSADMYMVYTPGGAQKLIKAGVPADKIAVVRNTLDLEEQRSLHAKFIDANSLAIRQKYNLRPDSIILLYVGRLYKEKRIEELLQLVKRINSEKLCQAFVEGVIIGDGPELTNLKENAKDNPGIYFLGAMYDQEIVAEYMRIASAMVIPGKVGLAVNHALAHGLPVITRESKLHAPEVEYIESGTNGLIIPGDFDEFVRQVVDCINSPQKLKKMSEAALETRESLSLEFMVKAFEEAVNKAIALKTNKKTLSS